MRPRLLRKSAPDLTHLIARLDAENRDLWDRNKRQHDEILRIQQHSEELVRELRSAEDEVTWLYGELRTATQQPSDKLRHRVIQLAARVNPEGRQYEGPDVW
jgi:hypothetical protein